MRALQARALVAAAVEHGCTGLVVAHDARSQRRIAAGCRRVVERRHAPSCGAHAARAVLCAPYSARSEGRVHALPPCAYACAWGMRRRGLEWMSTRARPCARARARAPLVERCWRIAQSKRAD
eukprot:6173147-Pleurochrysis_carterae.AAC.1